jgi:hypothetical protein
MMNECGEELQNSDVINLVPSKEENYKDFL